MTTFNSTISEPYKHLQNSQNNQNSQTYYGSADSTMAKASCLGVVGFGRLVPDSGSDSVIILTAMVNLP